MGRCILTINHARGERSLATSYREELYISKVVMSSNEKLLADAISKDKDGFQASK